MKLLNGVLLFLRMLTLVYCIDIDRGYPGGYYRYGDRNNDGRIDEVDLHANLNMGWLKEWYSIMKNMSNTANKDMIITEVVFANLIIGILQVTNKN